MELEFNRISKQVSSMAWPAIIHALLNTTLYFVDTLMIGRLGKNPLAAAGLANSITWSVSMFLFSLATATLALSARRFGEKNFKAMKTVAATSMTAALIIGTGVTVVMYFASGWVISLFIREAVVLPLTTRYFQILFCSFPFLYLSRICSSLLHSSGDTVSPMKVILLTNVLNLAADYGLIFGKFGLPEMGLNGAAAATVLSRIFQLSLFLYFVAAREPFKIRLRHLGLVSFDTARSLFRIALPAAMEAAVIHSGFLVFFKIVASLGSLPLATHHIALSIESLSFMFGVGLAIAAASIVGQKLGEGQPLGARFGANVALKKCLGIMLGIGTLLFLFPAALIRLFTSDPEIIRLGSTVLRIGAFEQPFLGSYMVLAGSLRGAGDTMRPMLVAILGSWIFRVPLVYFLAVNCGLGLPGVWLGTCLDWLFRAAAMFVLFRRGKWLEKKV